VKYCPSPACPHRARCFSPAEFVDRVTACADCGTPLVEDREVAIAGATPPKPSDERGYRQPAPRPAVDDAASRAKAAQLDVHLGIALVGFSVVVSVVTYAVAYATGGRTFLVCGLPLIYGLFRLNRGVTRRRALRER